MRSNTLRIAIPLALALLVAGCKKEGIDGPAAVCRPVSTTCNADSECCSYGCVLGSCRQNPLEGGACRTSDDCQYPRVCVDEQCTSSIACRGVASTCYSDGDCCSGDCTTGGECALDLAPVAQAGADALPDQPYRIPVSLSGAASTDPNTGTVGLVYEWSVLQAPTGSTAQPTSAGTVTTTFVPDVASVLQSYVLQLKVTKGALSATDTVTFKAVNVPPQIVMPADVRSPAYQSRNVELLFSATVSDGDGGPITCSWSKVSPSGVTTQVSAPTTCAGATGAAASAQWPYTLNEDERGLWELRLTVSDGVNTAAVLSRFVNVENDPPVANAGPKRWGNVNLGAIPLDGTATDVNLDVTQGNLGDSTFTWEWTVTARPAGSAINLGTVVGTTPSVSFTPDAEGIFTLTLTVDDGHGGTLGDSDTATVDVQVEPYILPLGEVVDAEYVDGLDRIVVAEVGSGGAYKLRVLDPTMLRPVQNGEVALAARPTSLALNPTATDALVGEVGGLWERITGISATPALTVASAVPATAPMPSDLVDIVHAGTCAFGVVGGGSVFQLFPTATGSTGTYWTAVSCPTCTPGTNEPLGTRAAATPASVWLLQTGTGRLSRYDIHSNCNLQNPVVSTYGALQGTAGLWLSTDEADLFSTRTSVWAASDLSTRVSGISPIVPDHLETTLVSGTLLGAVARTSTSSLATFSRGAAGTPFSTGEAVPLPVLGFNGDAVWNYGRFAFVKAGGGAYYAIVRANVGTAAAPDYRWGLVNLGP